MWVDDRFRLFEFRSARKGRNARVRSVFNNTRRESSHSLLERVPAPTVWSHSFGEKVSSLMHIGIGIIRNGDHCLEFFSPRIFVVKIPVLVSHQSSYAFDWPASGRHPIQWSIEKLSNFSARGRVCVVHAVVTPHKIESPGSGSLCAFLQHAFLRVGSRNTE